MINIGIIGFGTVGTGTAKRYYLGIKTLFPREQVLI